MTTGIPNIGSGGMVWERVPAEEAARQMETLFMTMLAKELRRSIPGTGLFGKGPGSQIYEGFFDSAMGEALALGRGSGLSAAILQTLAGKPAPERTDSAPAPAYDRIHQEPAQTSDHSAVSKNATPVEETERTAT